MQKRQWLAVGLLSGLIPVALGCGSATGIDTIAVSPSTQSLSVGQTAQFSATATTTHGQHPSTTEDVTALVSWTSSATSVATIDSKGMLTAVSPGTATITASINGFSGLITSTAAVTVIGNGGGSPVGSSVVSISIIPGTQSVGSPGQTSQFIAIGATSSGATEDLTNQVAWTSSSAQIASIAASGLATAIGQGTSTITAIYTNSANGTAVTGTATFTVVGGTSEQYTALTVLPNAQSVSASGQTGQFVAIATSGTGIQEDVSNSKQIKWTASIPTIATINSSGLVTGVSAGSTNITAELTNADNSVVSATASVTVTLTPAPEPLLALTIIPSTITVGNLLDTGQFLAIGTYSTPPTVRDLTNSVTWTTSAPNVFPVNTNGTGTPNPGIDAGVVTAEGSGGAVIIAEATDPATGSIQTATATFNCPLILPNPPTTAGSCYPGSQSAALLATITVYNEGANTTDWLVTADSATGTKNVLHCGPGSNGAGMGNSVCVASYPVGATVTLTAPATGAAFGGWSYNCTPVGAITAAGPNSCTITLTDNDSVGAIFN